MNTMFSTFEICIVAGVEIAAFAMFFFAGKHQGFIEGLTKRFEISVHTHLAE